jgi:transketolase
MTNAQLDQLSINCIRTLSIDAVQRAKSGHPGTPMALAPLIYTLWNRVMRFDPQDPIWPNRDRFVLSNGHASMLLWSVLHLTGTRAINADYERLGQPAVSLDDIRHFRQLGSKAPGHPEYHLVSGVEATTGPLGQGVATSVGMAIAEAWLANRYNRPNFEIFHYNIYAVCGDGCMMEGVGSEAASSRWEQASTFGWERYVGRRSGHIIGMKTFGASAPLKELLRKFRFEPERVTEIAKELLGKGNS